MLQFDEARRRAIQNATTLDAQTISLEESLGRILAEDVVASRSLPPFDTSAMDGYASHSGDFEPESGPWEMPVYGESRAGAASKVLRRGSFCRIFTGAAVPEGADSIVIQENVQRTGSRAKTQHAPKPGQHIRRKGEDLEKGQQALAKGTLLSPFHLSLLASLDHTEVRVARRPRVHILCTGDELRPPGSSSAFGQIPESNSIAIAGLALQAGAIPTRAPISSDNLEQTTRSIRSALNEADLLVTVGGVSVGDHDVVKAALEAADVELDFWKVKIKPGKPLVVGKRGPVNVLGLPGNPVSAQLTFCLFGLPMLRAMQGKSDEKPSQRQGILTKDLVQKPGRRGFYRVAVNGNQLTPAQGQSSGSTPGLAWANGVAVVPEDCEGYRAGEQVSYHLLKDL